MILPKHLMQESSISLAKDAMERYWGEPITPIPIRMGSAQEEQNEHPVQEP